MSLPEKSLEGTVVSAEEAQASILSRRKRNVLDVLAVIFWIYATVKLFIFDFDLYLVHVYAPSLLWATQLRFILIIGSVGLLFLFFKTQTIVVSFLYILFYPLIVIFWKLPVFIFKQKSWTLAFALANSIISFFRNLKQSAIKTALFFTSTALIFVSTNTYILIGAGSIVLILITLSFLVRLISVFRGSSLLAVYMIALNKWREEIVKTKTLDDELKGLAIRELSDDQLKLWSSKLESRVLFNRVCLFLARNLRRYQKSRLNIASGVFTTFTLLVMTIFSFAIINVALFKIDSSLYETLREPTFFDFFYYSFKNFLFSSIKEIEAVRPLSQSLTIVENSFALFLGIIFASLLISVRSQRYSDELDRAITMIEKQGKIMEFQIIKDFKIKTIDEALAELDRAKAGMISVLYWFSRNLN